MATDNPKRQDLSYSVLGDLNLACSVELPPEGKLGGVWGGGVLRQLFSWKLEEGSCTQDGQTE